jgi:hypothetical protein
MRNVKIDSTTDSPLDQRVAGMQPYNSVSLTVITASPSVKREDGSIEHGEDDIQNLLVMVPGRELRQNMLEYSKRVEDFKKQYPEFDRYVGQDIPIPLSVRDEILRQPNGPEVALFLGFAPDVIEQLCKMHPLDAAKCVESVSEDLERAAVPGEMDQARWKAARNLVKKVPARKPKP